MTSYRINHFSPKILVVFLVALGLLSAGLRVPDLSRPHRPKQTQRIVLEAQQKTFSNHIKQHDDLGTLVQRFLVSNDTVAYPPFSQAVPPLYASPLFPPNSGRSPPALKS